jgi:hypothetical protein
MSEQKTEYDALLEELEQMNKAMELDDEEGDDRIRAAAGEDEGEDEEPEGEGSEGEDEEEDEEEGEDDPLMGKAFTVEIEGRSVEAYDGTALVKSLIAGMESDRASLSKALNQVTSLIKAQGKEIAVLRKSLAAIGDTGRGRKAVLHVHEKTSTAPEKPEGLAPSEVLSKALSAMHAGRISANDVSLVETYINRGVTIPDNLLSKIA